MDAMKTSAYHIQRSSHFTKLFKRVKSINPFKPFWQQLLPGSLFHTKGELWVLFTAKCTAWGCSVLANLMGHVIDGEKPLTTLRPLTTWEMPIKLRIDKYGYMPYGGSDTAIPHHRNEHTTFRRPRHKVALQVLSNTWRPADRNRRWKVLASVADMRLTVV